MKSFSNPAKLFIVVVAGCGLAVLSYAGMHRETVLLTRFAAFLTITVLAARLSLRLPGMDSSMSVNLPFILVCLTQLSLLETVFIACSSALAQSLGKGKKADPVKVIFNVSAMACSIGLAFFLYNGISHNTDLRTRTLLLAAAAAGYFMGNTLPVAIIIGLTEKKNAAKLWGEVFLWTYPYYLASAGLASMVIVATLVIGWQTPLLILPIAYGVYCSFKKYFAGAQTEGLQQPLVRRASAL